MQKDIQTQNKEISEHKAKGLRHAAVVLSESYDRFWSIRPELNDMIGYGNRSRDAILEEINKDPAKFLESIILEESGVIALNKWLELNGESIKVPYGLPVGYSFDGSSVKYSKPSPVDEATKQVEQQINEAVKSESFWAVNSIMKWISSLIKKLTNKFNPKDP